MWKEGRMLPEIKSSVFWECSPAYNGGDSLFHSKIKSAARVLPAKTPADRNPFAMHLRRARGVPVSFRSSSTPSTTLVIPPDSGKNFSHIGNFYKHSTLGERKALWRKVAIELEKKLARGETVYVSTHGGGVHWVHVRLSLTPRYNVTDVAYVA
ncbi:EsV-1-207 [Ectocarpus siliculosus]|uniref:EsV-1-207 n=1 Tax=Ectocarpus siliculosus TaxID=2880 RepID=D7G321_ECTSI|nr:EsV-1-207 [Ectocarpus siliculosus]|eukprot:CBJ33464.1 EsV-1-207 [Ectocarpus siliculosus]